MWSSGSGRAPRRLRILAPLTAAALISSPLQAAEPADTGRESEMAERADLFIALLKRRAQRILEARRPPPPPLANLFTGVTHGYESNVNLDGSRKGDYFGEESVSFVFRPQVKPWLGGELSWDHGQTWFYEFTDSNLHSNTLKALLQLKPHRRLQLETGAEYVNIHFPLDTDSGFTDQRVSAHAIFAHLPWLSHKAGWVFQYREYDTRLAQDSAQNRVAGLVREDRRHTVLYEARLRFPKAFARLGTEYYRNFSNDHYQDYYDWNDWRFRALLVRTFSPKWIGTVSASHERKNYAERSVPTINVAQRDNLLTLAGSLIHQVNSYVSVTCSVTYRHQDSNDPRLDFTDWIHQVGLSAAF